MFIAILPFLSILIFRFIGLFIVLPVISLLIATMPHANEWTIGLAIGTPYLFQALCQPLFGRLSDKYGRKPILILGLIIFFIGSIVCMFETSIYYLIIGRCIQGMGAIGGLLTTLVADSVREEKRTSAMAIMGAGIFVSFVISMFLGSILGAHYGLNSLFILSACVTLLSLCITFIFVKPTPKITYIYPDHKQNADIEKNIKISIFAINCSGFVEKLLMVLTFALAPIILNEHIEKTYFWIVYVPAIVVGVLALGPTSILSEKRGKAKEVLLASILIFCIAYLCMALWIDNVAIFGIALALFFAAFSMQEALLQGLISKYARAKTYESITTWHWILFITLMICMVIWFLFVFITIKNPNATKTLYIPSHDIMDNLESLNTLIGVIEWYKNTQENVVTIKYNAKILDSTQIYAYLGIQQNHKEG